MREKREKMEVDFHDSTRNRTGVLPENSQMAISLRAGADHLPQVLYLPHPTDDYISHAIIRDKKSVSSAG
jgi:hypothetical protein